MRVGHFEIHADDPQKAIAFYKQMFGWEFSQWGENPYWLIKTGDPGQPGIDGGLMPRHGCAPSEGQAVNAYVCTVMVPNLDEMLGKLAAAGGHLALPKMPIPTIGWLAYGKDNQGNIFGMMQHDPAAQ